MTFTPTTILAVEDRIRGVFICDECGACVIYSAQDDRNRLQHGGWHRRLDREIVEASIEPTYGSP